MFLEPTRVHFDNLPRLVRQRLVASLRGHASPLPTLVRPTRPRWPRVVVAALALAVAVLAVLLRAGPRAAVPPAVGLAVLVAAGATIAALGGLALRTHLARRRLPWPPGQYVLGAYLVDATREVLCVESALAVVSTDVVHHHVDGGHVVTTIDLRTRDCVYHFTVAHRADALDALDRLEADLIALVEAIRAEDVEQVARLDPLFEARLDAPPSAQPPVRRPDDRPRLGRAPWSTTLVVAVAVALGGAAGAGLWWRSAPTPACPAR